MEQAYQHSPYSPHQIVAERYELLRLIGEGGMGEVWEARHLQLDAPVAIKFAIERRASEKAFLERFRREACAMARLRTPEIVQVFDTGVHAGSPFLVMEMLVGESLKSHLEREGMMPLDLAADLACQVARALSVIHRGGMVHRDVTPGNLFLLAPTPESPELQVKLLDFGIAKRISNEPRITTSGALVGSPAYMSPEQARAELVDPKSDLWSLGAVLYRCITGEDPFVGRSVTDVLFSICTGAVPCATKANPQLPPELEGFFERAFARNPSFRFPDAATMSAEFTAIADAYCPPPGTVTDTKSHPATAQRPRHRRAYNSTTLVVSRDMVERNQGVAFTRMAGVAGISAIVGVLVAVLLLPEGRTRLPFPPMASEASPLPTLPSHIPSVVTAPVPAASAREGVTTAPSPSAAPATAPTRANSERSAPRTRGRAAEEKAPGSSGVDPLFGLPVE